MSPGGALWIMPPPDSEHERIGTRLFAWLTAGSEAQPVLRAVGIRIPDRNGDGGRIPDLTVWSRPQPDGAWLGLADLLLVVEIVAPGSGTIDRMIKVQEYARAGIPRYWVVDRSAAETVTLYALGPNSGYEWAAKMPLALLLDTKPTDYLGV